MSSPSCSQCSASFNKKIDEAKDWFIDKGKNLDERDNGGQLFHICGNCRWSNYKTTNVNRSPNSGKCEVCWKIGEYGKGKWNLNDGLIICYSCDIIVCSNCHRQLHYNK